MVKIRFSLQGKKKSHFFFIVATDIRKPRNSGYIEKLGSYDPNKKILKMNEESLKTWMTNGAILTESVEKVLKRNNIQLA